MVFLKSLRRCDRKGDVELVLEVEKKLARELHAEAARAALGTMPNSFINLPVGVPHPSRTLPPTAASVGAAAATPAQPSQQDLAAQFGLNETALQALKDPAVRAALDPQVLAALGPVLQTL